jgi:hypothetical protein
MEKKSSRPRRYRQFAGFPGFTGTVAEKSAQGPKAVAPLTDLERTEMRKHNIPHVVEPPREYTPPPGPHTRRMGIELLGPLGLAAVVLFLFTWLLLVPASGENSYYELLLKGELTKLEPVEVHGDHGHGEHSEPDRHGQSH